MAIRRWTRREMLSVPVAIALSARFSIAGATADDAECVELEAFALPAGEGPHDVAPATDGVRVWYTGQRSGRMGLLDPSTGAVKRIPLGDGSAPHGVIVGPDGAAWVTDGGLDEIQRVDAETYEITRFQRVSHEAT